MFQGFFGKMLHRAVRQYRCEQCRYIFSKPHEQCPHCKGRLVEVIGKIENK